jgi:hypothetical protein
MSELGDRLREIHSWRKPIGGVHGQMMGCEPYRIQASGNALNWLIEAADALDALDVKVTQADTATEPKAMKDTVVARYNVSQIKARNGFDADESVVLGVDHDRRVEQLLAALRGYGRHVTSPNLCPAANFFADERGECDCGFAEWLAFTSDAAVK